jgi:hypothetical protein
MPYFCRVAAGPTPDIMRSCGDWKVPAYTVTSFVAVIIHAYISVHLHARCLLSREDHLLGQRLSVEEEVSTGESRRQERRLRRFAEADQLVDGIGHPCRSKQVTTGVTVRRWNANLLQRQAQPRREGLHEIGEGDRQRLAAITSVEML